MGVRYEISPIAPIEENTVRIAAGALTFGLEMRALNPSIVDDFYSERPERSVVEDLLAQRDALDDGGASIHVFGTEDCLEYLRFDCFDKQPHYHYVHPHENFQIVNEMDPVADGDPFEWALGRLRARLPQMLHEAGGGALAEHLDLTSVEDALRRIAELRAQNRTGVTA